MKRIILVFVCMVVIISCLANAYAANNNNQPNASRVIDTASVGISKSGNTLYAMATIDTVAIASKLGISSMYLYEYDGQNWKKVATATSHYGYNKDTYTYQFPYAATPGKQYKVVANFSATVGSISDTRTASGIKTF